MTSLQENNKLQMHLVGLESITSPSIILLLEKKLSITIAHWQPPTFIVQRFEIVW